MAKPQPKEKRPEIRVTCKGAALAELSDLVPIQGDLKSLSKEDFEKLKKSILRYGITFPFFVWRRNGKLALVDGTQRDRVLREIQKEGYRIPKLPVDFIEAKSEKEAKEKILLLSSQYGKMTNDSLYEFIEEGGLDFPDLKEILDLPQINFGVFERGYRPEPLGEFPSVGEDIETDYVCPRCGYEFSGGQTVQKEK